MNEVIKMACYPTGTLGRHVSYAHRDERIIVYLTQLFSFSLKIILSYTTAISLVLEVQMSLVYCM